ncbi:MAG: TetR family transcriptional regulator [Notoacmeibacter sp.]|nr:TetR family transcriptional regulator [Notoacmeibacter sp.]
MARTAGSDGEKTEAAIREAAARLIARHGFDAVTMRQLAAEVGVQAAALYRYFPAKEDLLFRLMQDHMRDLIAALGENLPGMASPTERLDAFIANHVRFHVERRHATHVSNMELRSLAPEHLSDILRLRGTYERELRHILREGAEDGSFAIEDVAFASMAIIQMVTGVIVWFRPDERLTIADVTRTYQTMTRRLAGAAENREALHVPERDEIRIW